MSPAAFIDANVPIYAAGREHPYKSPCADILRMVAENPQAFITDAEVLQELVHRYLAQGRWALGAGPRSPADLCPGDARPDRTGLRGRHPDGDGVGRPASGYKRPGPGPCGSDATPGNRPDHLCGHRLRPPAWNNSVGPPRHQGMGRVLPNSGRLLRRLSSNCLGCQDRATNSGVVFRQGELCLSMEFRMSSSLRMQATRANFFGLPADNSRW